MSRPSAAAEAYFSRQIVLDGFGEQGQLALARSRALVVGLGGTGTVASTCLALAGVGSISLLDRDEVSLENLHRQPSYALEDVGRSKAEVMARFLKARAPETKIEYHAESLDGGNAARFVRGADLVMDCLDNLPSRLSLNLSCVRRGVPLVHTGGLGWDGSVAVFTPPDTACLECLFPGEQDVDAPSCDQVGTIGAVTSIVGAMGALEGVHLLAAGASPLKGRLLAYDGRRASFSIATVRRRKRCGACGGGAEKGEQPPPRRLFELCGAGEYYVTRAFPPRSFPLILQRFGSARKMGESVISMTRDGVSLSFFENGGLLIKGVSSERDARAALESLGL